MTATTPTPGEFQVLVAAAQSAHQAGRLAEAADAYRQILSRWPRIAELHNNLGLVLKSQGRLDDAQAQLEQAIALKPTLADAYNNLGNVLKSQGRLDAAIEKYEQAVALRPAFAGAHNNLGVAPYHQRRFDEAAESYRRALALAPDFAEAHNNLGSALRDSGQAEQALACFEQAVALKPDLAEAQQNLGSALLLQNRLDRAAACFERALALRPDYPEAHNNLGSVLFRQNQLDAAAARYRQALALQPDFPAALISLAVTLRSQLKLDDACAVYERLQTLRPDAPDAPFGLAACYLIAGDYRRGWPAYEARLRMPEIAPRTNVPRWSGEPLAGRTLLFLAEQGLGDTLQFLRYARLLKARGARVVLAVQPALARLLAGYPDCDQLYVLDSASELPACDFHLPMLSAPYALGADGDSIPADIPYLWPDPALKAHWQAELAKVEGFKIGIVWQGSRTFLADSWRSFPLAELAPLARLPGVRLISLQKGFGSEQIGQVDFPVLDLADRLDASGPFLDTAAVIAGLDLVVAPDTAVVHLAGALGAPVWLPLHHSPTWRWLLDREDSPWYPTMRLFRQPTFDDWPGVFARMAAALRESR